MPVQPFEGVDRLFYRHLMFYFLKLQKAYLLKFNGIAFRTEFCFFTNGFF